MAYGKDTEVPFERSIAEIVGLVRKAGAQQIAQMEEPEHYTLQFRLAQRAIRFRVTFPTAAEVAAKKGPRQDAARFEAQWRRQRARALLLVIKAKLESVESGVETFEQAFLANVVLPGGGTVHERVTDAIALEYRSSGGQQLRLSGGPQT